MATEQSTYNGWANRATWNIALWINNDEPLYREAVEFMRGYTGRDKWAYQNFIEVTGRSLKATPDGYAYIDRDNNYDELNAMMRDLV